MESITKDKAYPFFVDGYYEGYVDGIEEGMKAREDSISQFMENMVAVVKMNLKDCSVKEIEKKLDLTEPSSLRKFLSASTTIFPTTIPLLVLVISGSSFTLPTNIN